MVATSTTYDELVLAVAREFFKGKWPIDAATTDAGAETTLKFDQMAYGASGATAQKFHDEWIYYRRVRGNPTAVTATTLTTNKEFGALDILVGGTVRIASGTGAGQTRTITGSSAGANCVLTVATWTTNPNTASVYEIYPPNADTIRTSKALSASPFNTDGTITVAPGYTWKIPPLTDFIFCRDTHPDVIKQYINDVLRNTAMWTYFPVTKVTDGDMEESGVASWLTTGTLSTKEKVASVFPMFRQNLHTVTSAVNSGVRSQTMRVNPDASVYVAALVRLAVSAGTPGAVVTLSLHNGSTGDVLKSVTMDSGDDQLIFFEHSINNGAELIYLTITADDNAVEMWIGGVWLTTNTDDRYIVPGLTYGVDPIEVMSIAPAGGFALGTDLFSFNSFNMESFTATKEGGSGAVSVTVRPNAVNVVRTLRRWPELSADTDTTLINKNVIVSGAMYYLMRMRAAEAAPTSEPLARYYEAQAARFGRIYGKLLTADGIPAVLIKLGQAERIETC